MRAWYRYNAQHVPPHCRRKRNWRAYDEDYGPPASAARGGGGGGTGGIFKSAAIEVLNQEKKLMATGRRATKLCRAEGESAA